MGGIKPCTVWQGVGLWPEGCNVEVQSSVVGRGWVVPDGVIQAGGRTGAGSECWRTAQQDPGKEKALSRRTQVGRGQSCLQDLGTRSGDAEKTWDLQMWGDRRQGIIWDSLYSHWVLCPGTESSTGYSFTLPVGWHVLPWPTGEMEPRWPEAGGEEQPVCSVRARPRPRPCVSRLKPTHQLSSLSLYLQPFLPY